VLVLEGTSLRHARLVHVQIHLSCIQRCLNYYLLTFINTHLPLLPASYFGFPLCDQSADTAAHSGTFSFHFDLTDLLSCGGAPH